MRVRLHKVESQRPIDHLASAQCSQRHKQWNHQSSQVISVSLNEASPLKLSF